MAKKRSQMSVDLAKASSAAEIAQILGDAWLGYGVEEIIEGPDDTATVTINTLPKTWKAAQKALWLKPKFTDGDLTIYRMYNMGYELAVTVSSKDDDTEALHTVLIRPATQISTKEDSPFFDLIRFLHLAGQHNQKRHGSRYGSIAKIKRSLRALSDDPEAKQGYREQARKRAGLKQKPMPSRDRKQLAAQAQEPVDLSNYSKDMLAMGGQTAYGIVGFAKNIPQKGKYGPNIRETIENINQLHGFPEGMDTFIPIELSSSKRALGTYYHQSAGRMIKNPETGEYERLPVEPIKIVVMRNNDHPRLTTAHEMGHYLDHQGRLNAKGEKAVWGSEQAVSYELERQKLRDNPTFAKFQTPPPANPTDGVMEAITKSAAYQSIGKDMGREYDHSFRIKNYQTGEYETKTIKMKFDTQHGRYLQKPKEAFARAYSQYVATKVNDPKIKAELKEAQEISSRDARYSSLWQDDDFKPIEKAFDDFFISAGLSKEKGT